MPHPYFPYMVWAHESSGRTPHVLSVSGLPNADPALFAGLPPIELSHPSAQWLPKVEQQLARSLGVDPQRVIVCLGASGAMHLAAAAWFRPGMRVYTDRPSYEPFRALPLRFGATLIECERRLEQGFAWPLPSLPSAPGGACAFLANPHNPSGALSSASAIQQLAHGLEALIVCEIYMEWIPKAQRVHAALLAPNGVSIGSLTKAYGLGPLRAGWLVLGEGLVHERQRLIDLLYLDYVDPPTMALRAYSHALEHLEALAQPIAALLEHSRPPWERFLQSCPDLEAWIPPHGFIAFPRVRGVADTRELCEALVHEFQVDVVPGHFFGAPQHIRVGCPQPPAMVQAGLERLRAGLAALRPRFASR